MTQFINQLGPYQLHAEFQRGSVAHIYRATDTRNGETVLVHLLAPLWVEDQAIVAAFLAAGRAAQRLKHPNIVPILDCNIFEGQPYIVSQFVADQTLEQLLRRRGQRLENRDVITIVEALAAALDAAHAQQVIHGAVGLDTIYVTSERKVLLDGFYTVPLPRSRNLPPPGAGQPEQTTSNNAPAADADAPSTLATLSLPRWPVSPFMAPEQARDEATLDQRADVYSLGAITYTMLLGRLPFVAADRGELLGQIINQLPPAPETIDPAIATGVAYVLKSVLAKDPAIRYGKASEFASALAQGSWLAAAPAPAIRSRPNVPDSPAKPKRRKGAAWLVTALLLFTALTLAILVSNQTLRNALLARLPGTAQLALPALVTPVDVGLVPTAAQLALTPQVMVSLTPVTEIVTTPVALLIEPDATGLVSTTVATPTAVGQDSAALVITPTITLTVRTSVKSTPTIKVTLTNSLTTTLIPTRALRLDPLHLLDGNVAAGDIIVNGEASPGAQIRLFVDSRPIGQTVVKSTGTWSIIARLMRLGDYMLVAQEIDANGAVVASATNRVTVVEASTAALSSAIAATTQPTLTNTSVPTVTNTATKTATGTAKPLPTATKVATFTPTPTVTRTLTRTSTPLPPTLTSTPRATATARATNTATVTNTSLPTATNTALATATLRPTNTVVLQPTNPVAPTNTATRRLPATNTPLPTDTAAPTATLTNTRMPTATNTPRPTATNTARPTATNTPLPTVTTTTVPTATKTNTPLPTATATNTPLPTATKTNTTVPTATKTNTPLPTATKTNTPLPTATNTPLPTATPLPPTATNTPLPTATPLPPTVTNTPVPTWTPVPTNTPAPTATSTPVPPPTVASGQVTLVEPVDGTTGGGQRIFRWTPNFTPSPGTAFELVFWRPGEDPLASGFGLAAPTTESSVTADLDALDDVLGDRLDNGDEYRWGVLLVRTDPYTRVSYLGGGYTFLFSRSNGGGGGGGNGGSSGE